MITMSITHSTLLIVAIMESTILIEVTMMMWMNTLNLWLQNRWFNVAYIAWFNHFETRSNASGNLKHADSCCHRKGLATSELAYKAFHL